MPVQIQNEYKHKYKFDLLNRRRSKQPEQLQIGKDQTPNSRRGSVGSVGSADLPGSASKKTPAGKATKAVEPVVTPKSGKKQVTIPLRLCRT